MVSPVLSSLLVLLQLICVIIVVAYLFTRSRMFSEVLSGHLTVKSQIILILVFGALSIYGTLSGIEFFSAIVNVRDLGPMLAGLLGGPVVGVGAGLIGAAYRMSLGGFTVYSCSLATVLAGLFGGIIWLACGRRFAGITISVLFAILMEGFHMLLTLVIARPFDQAVTVVSTVALPMILANAAGMFVFAFIFENLRKEREMQAERDSLLREMERKKTELAIAAENSHDDRYGVLWLKEIILASRRIPSSDVIQAILMSVKDFTGEKPQSDDINLMVIRSL
jgi:sigma-B regulation protein RsbU (phosphoserine phosphatase)